MMNKMKKKKPTMMKYNKKEEQAVDVLFRLADGLKTKQGIYLDTSESTLLKNVLGIDILDITLSKKDAEKKGFIRGKDEMMIILGYYHLGYRERYCYFPFQIKK
eukprot:Anaeramoba_ignava/a608107_55.p2 GENE.a608107_55~~a608107_55.p2  ORF type:complete len:104 (-),score=17.96 a608107_55:1692-2003(-)